MHSRIDTLSTHVGPRRALVVAPGEPIVVGRERLERMRLAPAGSALDQQIVRAAQAADDVHLLVFDATPEGSEGSYRIDPALDDDDAAELVHGLVVTQIPTYRRLVEEGMAMQVHAGLALRDCQLFKEQTLVALAELGSQSGPEAELDRWILEHMTFFYTASYERLKQSTLPGVLPLVERRVQRQREPRAE